MSQEKAIFAAGCFWGVQKRFDALKGVIATRVGYTGGHTDSPTYKGVCAKDTGHAEAIEVTFDSQITSYEDLLRAFFAMHNPTSSSRQGRDDESQYRSAIFHVSAAQKTAALAYIKQIEKEAPSTYVHTQVALAGTFWQAEEYHQKYYLK